jgi:nitrogen-specific signal transduction histidine kinase
MITSFFDQRDALLKEMRDRRQLEKSARDREAQIRQTEKMDAISRLAAGVAHDFNNLLTTIVGYSAILLDEFKYDARTRQDVEQIANAGERAAALLKRLTAFGRKGASSAKAIDLNEAVRSMSDQLEQIATEKVELRVAAEASPSSVRIDSEQAKQLILQLAQNACDAMRQGGNLTVATTNTLIPETTQHNGMELPAGSYVTLQVTDTGTGMDENTRERMFEPFFTTDPAGKKAGLGLAMVYGIVRQSGGAIAVNGEEGSGTTVLVHLPTAQQLEGSSDSNGERSSIPAERAKRNDKVLVLEPDAAVRELISVVLRQDGYAVITASQGDSVSQRWRERRDEIVLIIADALADASNREDVARIREEVPHMRVLVLRGEGIALPADLGPLEDKDILDKPFTLVAFRESVRRILHEAVSHAS